MFPAKKNSPTIQKVPIAQNVIIFFRRHFKITRHIMFSISGSGTANGPPSTSSEFCAISDFFWGKKLVLFYTGTSDFSVVFLLKKIALDPQPKAKVISPLPQLQKLVGTIPDLEVRRGRTTTNASRKISDL